MEFLRDSLMAPKTLECVLLHPTSLNGAFAACAFVVFQGFYSNASSKSLSGDINLLNRRMPASTQFAAQTNC